MRLLFETTWTCDYCGNPNLQSDLICRHCGTAKPARYGKVIIRNQTKTILLKTVQGTR